MLLLLWPLRLRAARVGVRRSAVVAGIHRIKTDAKFLESNRSTERWRYFETDTSTSIRGLSSISILGVLPIRSFGAKRLRFWMRGKNKKVVRAHERSTQPAHYISFEYGLTHVGDARQRHY